MEVLYWAVGVIVALWAGNILLSRWLLTRLIHHSYHAQMQHVLHHDEHKVKGRFE